MKQAFKTHLSQRLSSLFEVMDNNQIETLFIEAGQADYYFLDDQSVPFRTNPHFNFLCPAEGEGHILELRLNQKPLLHIYSPKDFWHQGYEYKSAFWLNEFDLYEYEDTDTFWKHASTHRSYVLSPNPDRAVNFGFSLVSPHFIDALNWLRSSKTDYEIQCIRKACEIASQGHQAARTAFFSGCSEFEILMAYQKASQQRENQLPYNPIIALDQHAAILHYQNTAHKNNGQSFLIDAGAKFQGYCSDISRTYFQESAHSLYKDMCAALTRLQKEIIDSLRPGMPYPEAHKTCFLGISKILMESGLAKGSLEELSEMGITRCFFPHGVGHPLGLQVHDVGAKQRDLTGQVCPQDKDHPHLRTLRDIQDSDVLTIEPGLYFIPQLLDELRQSSKAASIIHWGLVQELIPFGGIRIEDNLLVAKSGTVNLSRLFLD